jgi:hypothetical protein
VKPISAAGGVLDLERAAVSRDDPLAGYEIAGPRQLVQLVGGAVVEVDHEPIVRMAAAGSQGDLGFLAPRRRRTGRGPRQERGNHFFELAAVHVDQRQPIGEREVHANAGGVELGPHDPCRPIGELVDVLPPAAQRRSLGECQQVADDADGARGILLDFTELVRRIDPRPARRQHQLGIADHALQRALQFLRDARHQLTHMCELFLLADLDPVRRNPRAQADQRAPPHQLARDQQGRERRRHDDSYSVHRPLSSVARPSVFSFSRCARTFSRAAGISAGARPS